MDAPFDEQRSSKILAKAVELQAQSNRDAEAQNIESALRSAAAEVGVSSINFDRALAAGKPPTNVPALAPDKGNTLFHSRFESTLSGTAPKSAIDRIHCKIRDSYGLTHSSMRPDGGDWYYDSHDDGTRNIHICLERREDSLALTLSEDHKRLLWRTLIWNSVATAFFVILAMIVGTVGQYSTPPLWPWFLLVSVLGATSNWYRRERKANDRQLQHFHEQLVDILRRKIRRTGEASKDLPEATYGRKLAAKGRSARHNKRRKRK